MTNQANANYQGTIQSGSCKCGGLILQPGIAYGYAGPVCHCTVPTPINTITTIGTSLQQALKTGWICPKCNTGVSPFKDKCGG